MYPGITLTSKKEGSVEYATSWGSNALITSWQILLLLSLGVQRIFARQNVSLTGWFYLNHYKIQFDLTCSQVFSEMVRRIATNDIPADSV